MYVRYIIQYSEGGYFGDSDVFSYLSGISNRSGRDSSCIADTETTIFVMSINEIKRMQEQFEDIYNEMLDIAIKRHNNHQALIQRELDQYLERIQLDSDVDSSQVVEIDKIEDASADGHDSLDSDRIEKDFKKDIIRKRKIQEEKEIKAKPAD